MNYKLGGLIFFVTLGLPRMAAAQNNLTIQKDSIIYMSDFYSCPFDIERAPYGTSVVYWDLKRDQKLSWGQGSDHPPGTRNQNTGSWKQVNDSIILKVEKPKNIKGLVLGEQRFRIYQLKWTTDTRFQNITMTSYCVLLINDSSFDLKKTILELNQNLESKMTTFTYDPKEDKWINDIVKHHNFDETVRQFFNSKRIPVSIKVYNGKNLTPWTM